MRHLLLSAFLFASIGSALATENINDPRKPNTGKVLAACANPTSSVDLDANNVRTRLLSAGDQWWDLDAAKYEIPKIDLVNNPNAPRISALFAGALWIGGKDASNSTLVAAQTYRQGGNGFVSGPLDVSGGAGNIGTTDPEQCQRYNKHFKINQDQISNHISLIGKAGYEIPKVILEWPGNGEAAQNEPGFLAPFFEPDSVEDLNSPIAGTSPVKYNKKANPNKDGKYDPLIGEYPIFDPNAPSARPDQFVWWVYNDVGPNRKDYASDNIGLEIQTTAFAYQTSDDLNNTTFYRNIIYNRSTNTTLDSTYFGVWADADLGYAFDDYVGCDVSRGLGYCYNGDDNDDAPLGGYGQNPPSVGIDFFKGPNDENGKEIGLSKFVYFNNDNTDIGNPTTAAHIYFYLSGKFKDGTPLSYGSNGYKSSTGEGAANFMFPDDTDPLGRRQWTERSEGNIPGDRRFIESAGPFKLLPGAKNEVTYGVVWARKSNGGAAGSLNLLKCADDLAQKLFNNNFNLADGPTAPNVNVTELPNKIILAFEDVVKTESYVDAILDVDKILTTYKFEGYKLYQLSGPNVRVTDLENPDKAIIVQQSDRVNGVAQIVNFETDCEIGFDKPLLKVNGENKGLKHILEVTEDFFSATSNTKLVNNRPYYYMLVPYANGSQSKREKYLQGRLNIKTYTCIPHDFVAEAGGTTFNTKELGGFELKRLSGKGNSDNIADIKIESENELFNGGKAVIENPVYEAGRGPVNVRVVDPRLVANADFQLKLNKNNQGKYIGWTLTNLTNGKVINSDDTLGENQQFIKEYSFIIQINNSVRSAAEGTNGTELFSAIANDPNNGFLDASIDFDKSSGNKWFFPILDVENPIGLVEEGLPTNWVANSKDRGSSSPNRSYDPNNKLTLLNGLVAPFRFLNASSTLTPYPSLSVASINNINDSKTMLNNLPSVNIVLTKDKTKWSRCIVLEACGNVNLAEGGQKGGLLRKGQSLDINGNPETGAGNLGLSWFPGYAVNTVSGERLNILFSESSANTDDNGRDMQYNPTNNIFGNKNISSHTEVPFAGRHYVIVQNNKYDSCKVIYNMLKQNNFNPSAFQAKPAFLSYNWTFVAAADQTNFLSSDVRIRIRMKSKYADFATSDKSNNDAPLYAFNTKKQEPIKNVTEDLKQAVEQFRIVPNPYYAFSQYETGSVDTRARFTNVPNAAIISIYSVDGVLVRRLTQPNSNTTQLDWDLRNTNNVPVASGAYIIHIKAFYGDNKFFEKTLTWFNIARPIDLGSF